MLFVDDDVTFRMLMRSHLEALGFSVIEADDGKRVVDLILGHKSVACVIDLMMVQQEGLETIQKIADLDHRPKVLAVSSEPLYLDIALAMGADATLTKPVAPDDLHEALQRQGVVEI